MEKQEDTVNKADILDKIYEIRQEDFEAESSKDREYLSKILNEVKVEKIEEKINEVLNKEEAKNITKKIELLVENYEIQIAYYSKKNYKQGFKDAICLYTQCLEGDYESNQEDDDASKQDNEANNQEGDNVNKQEDDTNK